MSLKTQTNKPTSEEEIEEWLAETEKLKEMSEKLKQMQDAKALGLPFKNLNEEQSCTHSS